jgi:hypothetical protein
MPLAASYSQGMRRSTFLLALALVWALLAGVACAGAGTTKTGQVGQMSAKASVPAWVLTARHELGKLQVRPLGSLSGYSRAQFGSAWQDVDHNGCDTRNDILHRDLVKIVLRSDGCTIQSGLLHDPYTGKAIHFLRGVQTSSAVQIDHVVALGNAWETGAKTWTADKRLHYANDPVVLLAVDGPQNESKGDSDASRWLPPNRAYDCAYVARQVTIKFKYHLWVSGSEKSKMASVLSDCAHATPPQTTSSKPGSQTGGSTGGGTASGTVHPGSYCSAPGATGHSSSGATYVCKSSATDTRLRWRQP